MLGKKPVVLVFATPQLCQSRVCGPVVDIAEQVQAESATRSAFIHKEIYNDNEPNKGLRPQLRGLPPADRALDVRHRPQRARSSHRFEGALSVGELERAVAKVECAGTGAS